MNKGRKLFYVLLFLGVLSCAVFWRVPANKYEWMRTDPVVGDAPAHLPDDPDAAVPLVVFALPALIVAILSLLNAVFRLQGEIRTLAICFSAALVLVVIVKFKIQ